MPDPFTSSDYQQAHAMGISLDEQREHQPAIDRLYSTLAVAYHRLENECARAYRAERDVRAERDQARRWLKLAVLLLASMTGLALGMGWVIYR